MKKISFVFIALTLATGVLFYLVLGEFFGSNKVCAYEGTPSVDCYIACNEAACGPISKVYVCPTPPVTTCSKENDQFTGRQDTTCIPNTIEPDPGF